MDTVKDCHTCIHRNRSHLDEPCNGCFAGEAWAGLTSGAVTAPASSPYALGASRPATPEELARQPTPVNFPPFSQVGPGPSPYAVADDAGGAVKADTGKAPISLVPRSAILAEAEVLGFGARKYAAHNWRKGMKWSRLVDAAQRHLLAWADGEDVDPETGLTHLAHLRACAGFLIEYQRLGLGEDDRYRR